MSEHGLPDSYWVVPNKLLAGEHPSANREAAARRRIAALLDAGIRSFVDLTDRDNGVTPYDRLVRALAEERGVDARYRRMAIRDGGIPTGEQMAAIVGYIEREIAEGRAVYLHCLAGIGRTGTVVGCWLVNTDACTAIAALERIAHLRRGTRDAFTHSPETHEQRDFIVRWACAKEGTPALSLRERCDALLKFAPHFHASDAFATLVSPAMGMPYCQLSPWASEFIQTIEDAGWCSSCDWQAWEDEGLRYVDDPARVGAADADVLARLLTLHVALERRNEGHLADMAERGHLKVILERLQELRDLHATA